VGAGFAELPAEVPSFAREETTPMKCHTPGCTAEREAQEISHSVIYRERTVVVHHVPAEVCPECGDAMLAEETAIQVEALLRRKARSKGSAFHFEI
jgi:YgiT-type zinc finger domain-containing protein